MIFLHVHCTLTLFILTNQDPVRKKQNYVSINGKMISLLVHTDDRGTLILQTH